MGKKLTVASCQLSVSMRGGAAVAREAHNLEDAGSNPAPAITANYSDGPERGRRFLQLRHCTFDGACRRRLCRVTCAPPRGDAPPRRESHNPDAAGLLRIEQRCPRKTVTLVTAAANHRHGRLLSLKPWIGHLTLCGAKCNRPCRPNILQALRCLQQRSLGLARSSSKARRVAHSTCNSTAARRPTLLSLARRCGNSTLKHGPALNPSALASANTVCCAKLGAASSSVRLVWRGRPAKPSGSRSRNSVTNARGGK